MIKVYLNTFMNFIVIINNEFVYEMNESANLPNGLNMYCGELNELLTLKEMIESNQLKEMVLGDLPKSTLIAIINRSTENWNDN